MNGLLRKTKPTFWLQFILGCLSVGLMQLLTSRPAKGAERIVLSYGVLQQSIPIDALETYATTGGIESNIAAYASLATPEQLIQLQQLLRISIPYNAEQLAQFIETPLGKQLVHRLSSVIRISHGKPLSGSAIKQALTRAASASGDVTLLSVLQEFSANQIEIDLARILEITKTLRTLGVQTNQTIAQINQQANQEAAARLSFHPLPSTDLRQPGQFAWKQRTITLSDDSRNRTFPVDLYLPLTQRSRPVIVISHGLSANRQSFAYLAEHLASYGFVVAVPEHPGSNWQYLLALFQNKTDRIIPPQEFIDRPSDITFLLDELSELTQADPTLQGRLNLQQVGIIGQSLGGYTALALAGASLNFETLETNCQTLSTSLNLSLLLQCQALMLPQRNYNLADPRVKAVLAISPISSSILGQVSLSQIDVPVLIMAGSEDILAPVLSEQIRPFTWLTTADKYLALMNGGTHFSSVTSPHSEAVFMSHQGDKLEPAIAHRYVAALSTAFLQSYVDNRSSYRPYLSAAYANSISSTTSQLSLVESIASHPSHLNRISFVFDRSLIALVIVIQSGIFYFTKTHNR